MHNPTELNKDDVQILFADLQVKLVSRSKTTPPPVLASSVNVLARVARLLEIPIILSVVPEGGRTPELIPELAKETTGLPQFLRTGAKLDERTKEALAANRRNTIIISGFATEAVVLHAATAAIACGHRVLIPVDACGGLSNRTEAAAFRQIEAGEKLRRLLR
jgi:nicotinamidase-related amidase